MGRICRSFLCQKKIMPRLPCGTWSFVIAKKRKPFRIFYSNLSHTANHLQIKRLAFCDLSDRIIGYFCTHCPVKRYRFLRWTGGNIQLRYACAIPFSRHAFSHNYPAWIRRSCFFVNNSMEINDNSSFQHIIVVFTNNHLFHTHHPILNSQLPPFSW